MGKRGHSFNLQATPGHLLRRCHQRSRRIFDEVIGASTGLSRQQVSLLIGIDRNPQATQARLSEETGFDRNTLAELMNRLISKKLVERRRAGDDARAYEVSLSQSGAALVRSMYPKVRLVQMKILAPLPAQLRPTFLRCLHILSASMGPERESGWNDEGPERRKRAARRTHTGRRRQPASAGSRRHGKTLRT
jgi:DNA-binding MarR family transcriptional regulator